MSVFKVPRLQSRRPVVTGRNGVATVEKFKSGFFCKLHELKQRAVGVWREPDGSTWQARVTKRRSSSGFKRFQAQACQITLGLPRSPGAG
jgi:hypothetical protein